MPKKIKHPVDKNFFNEMNYEIAGDIGIVDGEEMKNNQKLLTGKKSSNKPTKKAKK